MGDPQTPDLLEEIADCPGIHHTTVSKAVTGIREK